MSNQTWWQNKYLTKLKTVSFIVGYVAHLQFFKVLRWLPTSGSTYKGLESHHSVLTPSEKLNRIENQ